MAILTNVSAVQRIYEVYWRTSQLQSATSAAKIVQPSDQPPVQG
jgi:hypothetical protein